MSSPTTLKAGILIVSTTAAAGTSEDLTTPLLRQAFVTANDSNPTSQWDVAAAEIVKDDLGDIQLAICKWTNASVENRMNLVVTSGGTGFSQSDVTPEVNTPLRMLGTGEEADGSVEFGGWDRRYRNFCINRRRV